MGGVNDGTIEVVVKGFQAASFFGASVHAVVETVPFVNRTTEVTATTMVSAADYVVASDEITVPIPGGDGTSGYRVYLTSAVAGGVADGGTDASAKDAAADASRDAAVPADATVLDATAAVEAGNVDSAGGGVPMDAAGADASLVASGGDSGPSDDSGGAAGCGCSLVGDAQRSASAGEWLALLGLAAMGSRARAGRGRPERRRN